MVHQSHLRSSGDTGVLGPRARDPHSGGTCQVGTCVVLSISEVDSMMNVFHLIAARVVPAWSPFTVDICLSA